MIINFIYNFSVYILLFLFFIIGIIPQWCDNLDSLIKCPVCTKKLSGSIYICESGHNICGVCTKKVSPCMLCSKPYTSIRNSIAEVLAPQADQIKVYKYLINYL